MQAAAFGRGYTGAEHPASGLRLCGRIVLACATYDGFLFPPMENLLAKSFLCGVRLSLSEQIVLLHRLGFAGVVLLVVADQGTVLVPQGNHVDIAVVLCVVIGIDDVVAGIRREPLDHLADGFHRVGITIGFLNLLN